MKKLIFVLFIVFTIYLNCIVEETGSFQAFIYGEDENLEYSNFMSHIAEGVARVNYNLYAPYESQNSNFGDYRIPSSSELSQWSNIVTLFLNGDYTEAENQISSAGFPYQIVLFHDTDTNNDLYLLRENLNNDHDTNETASSLDDEHGSFDYGWGLYVVNQSAEYPIIVSVPHPNDDFISPVFGALGYRILQAKYLLVAGAGREVKWTNVSPYWNSKSLSDPSRNVNHPFSVFYNLACDKIRETFGRREFSLQVHSYDWNRHEGHAPLQISAGNGKGHPDLPIRDLSEMKYDMINLFSHLIIPANTIGVHDDVRVANYLAVHNTDGDFTYLCDGEELDVSNHIDLPGYSQNKQQVKTTYQWTDFDRFDPFFHIEMDELPDVYPQTLNNYHWFYGYDEIEGSFNPENYFKHSVDFYTPWLLALKSSIFQYFNYQVSDSPTTPTNLAVSTNDFYQVRLSWERASDYDFSTYEILYATESIGDNNFEIYDRSNNPKLATINCEWIDVNGLTSNQEYYFKVRAKDEMGNYSDTSNEVSVITGCANITNFKAFGYDGNVDISWRTTSQDDCTGFIIERKIADGEYEVLSSYETNENLLGSDVDPRLYNYIDENVTNDVSYKYRLKSVSNNNQISIHKEIHDVKPEKIYALYFYDTQSSLSDTIYFGKNLQAWDQWDANYDIVANGYSGNYVYAKFYEYYWQTNRNLKRHIIHDFDSDNELRKWVVKFKSNQINHNIQVGLVNPDRNSEKLYLKRGINYTNLNTDVEEFIISSSSEQTLELFFGNLEPEIIFTAQNNRIYQIGESFEFSWNTNLKALVNNFDIYLVKGENRVLLESGIDKNQTSYSFNLDNPLGNDVKILIRANLVNGDFKEYFSDFTFGIFSNEIEWNISDGKSMMSVPFINVYGDLNGLFGDYSLYKWQNGEFENSDMIASEFAYWLNGSRDENVVQTFPINKESIDTELINGWNLVPNQHLCDYYIYQFRVVYNSISLSFNEAVQFGLVSPDIYIYNSGYKKTDIVESFNSFWIKANVDNVVLRQIPYNDRELDIENNHEKRASLIMMQNNDYDNIEVVVSEKDNHKISKFPNKPFDNSVGLSANLENILYQQIIVPYPSLVEPEIQEVLLDIQVDNDSPVSFKVDYNVDWFRYRLSINDEIHILSEEFTEIESIPENSIIKLLILNPCVNNEISEAPHFSLSNYPNPFNPKTRIFFSVPKTGKTTLNIYNVKGQLVKRLVNDTFTQGNHFIEWIGNNDSGNKVASGVYFCKLKQGKNATVKKLLLLK